MQHVSILWYNLISQIIVRVFLSYVPPLLTNIDFSPVVTSVFADLGEKKGFNGYIGNRKV